MLLVVAAGLLSAALLQLAIAPLGSGAMVLAAVAVVALVHERSSTRHTVRLLSERLSQAATLDKLEVVDTGNVAALEHALNRIIQQVREHAEASRAAAQPAKDDGSRMAAVLSIGVRPDMAGEWAGEWVERVLGAPALARAITDGAATASVESDGTLVVVCGGREAQPATHSMQQALAIAQALAGEHALRFGLSCGQVRVCAAAGIAPKIIGAPCAEAIRLARMAVAWHEYELLAAEPVALLARAFRSQRTPLTLTSVAAPALPVYTLELTSNQSVAMSA